jgi:membrane protein implicated in regulation of membrane protease activity
VAAATKLSFTMEQSNIIIAILYRLLSLYRQFEPWSQIVSVAVLIVGLYLVSRRFVKIRVTRAK